MVQSARKHGKPIPTALALACAQRGFTLVEVLVSVVVLSLGVLGAVGMQAASLQSNKEIRYQVIGASIARELAEKMRGNHAIALKSSASDNPYLIPDTIINASSAFSIPTPNCLTASCSTGLNIAAWDMYDLKVRLKDALPSPRIVVCMDSAPFTSDGLPRWACDNTGDVAVLKLGWNRATSKRDIEFTSLASSLPLIVLPLTSGNPE